MVVSAGLNPRVFKQARGGAPRRGARRQLLSIGPVVQAATLPKSRLARWLIAPRDALKKGEVYNVSVRMYMDRDFLSKPLQVNAINDSSWRLSTNRKTFTYRAE